MNCTQEKRERERRFDPVGWKTSRGKNTKVCICIVASTPIKTDAGQMDRTGFYSIGLHLNKGGFERVGSQEAHEGLNSFKINGSIS